MYICYGVDANGDGKLEASEFGTNFSNNKNGQQNYDVKVVSTATYNYAKSFLAKLANTPYAPTADNWLFAFLTNAGLAGAQNLPGTLTTSAPGYNSHVGANFNPNQQSAPINVATFGVGSQVELAVASDATMDQTLNQIVQAEFEQQSEQESILSQLTGENEWQSLSVTVAAPSSFAFLKSDPDLYLAMKDVDSFSTITINFQAERIGDYLKIAPQVSAQIGKLYDFNYSDSSELGGLVQLGALVEAGYPTAGAAGHIFQVYINFIYDYPVILSYDIVGLPQE
jgi:hypothetical protein